MSYRRQPFFVEGMFSHFHHARRWRWGADGPDPKLDITVSVLKEGKTFPALKVTGSSPREGVLALRVEFDGKEQVVEFESAPKQRFWRAKKAKTS